MASIGTASVLLRDLDEHQLKSLIRAKKYQRRLEALDDESRRLQAQIAQNQRERDRLEKKIRSITKSATLTTTRTRRGPTLTDAIITTLTKSGPLGLTELTHAILKGRNYRTTSTFQNFRTTVAHTLRHIKNQLTKNEEGYTVKKASTKSHSKKTKKVRKTSKPMAKPAVKKSRKTTKPASKHAPKAKPTEKAAPTLKTEPAQVTAPA